jgi:hypothetical protein
LPAPVTMATRPSNLIVMCGIPAHSSCPDLIGHPSKFDGF